MSLPQDPAQEAAKTIQERYRSFRKKRELAGLALSKSEWTPLLNQVDSVLRTSQSEADQPKQLSVRGKWLKGVGCAGAIGRVRFCIVFAVSSSSSTACIPSDTQWNGFEAALCLQGSADGEGGGLLLRKEHWSVILSAGFAQHTLCLVSCYTPVSYTLPCTTSMLQAGGCGCEAQIWQQPHPIS